MLEIKYKISIDSNLVFDVVKKSRNTSIQRYYILTTAKDTFISNDEELYINKFILSIRNDTGIDIIPNGIYIRAYPKLCLLRLSTSVRHYLFLNVFDEEIQVFLEKIQIFSEEI
jgi:hypothetical protein